MFFQRETWMCFNYSCVRKPELLTTFISWHQQVKWTRACSGVIALADVRSVWLDGFCRAPEIRNACFSAGLESPKLISPGVTISAPNKMFFKNNDWFVRFLSPPAAAPRIGCWHITSLSPLSSIFPKLKTYRPKWLNDGKQTLFTQCNKVIFFCHWRKKYVLFLFPFKSLNTPKPRR